jgi:hypothetical protein
MKLSKINYMSAVTFGIFAFIMFFVLGILRLVVVSAIPALSSVFGESHPVEIITTPILGGLTVLLFFLLVIIVYNQIAKKYPVTWEIKK